MFTRFAKLLLVGTSLAPVLGAVAVNQIAAGEPWTAWIGWLATALGCIGVCALMLRLARTNGERQPLLISEAESSDHEMLGFLLAYLMPFVASDKLGFTGEWLTGAYILLLIFLAVGHGDTRHFNPVLGLLGYHFYSVKTTGGLPFLLITRRVLRRTDEPLTVVQLTDSIYLETT